MSIFEKLRDSIESNDFDGFASLLHEDYMFHRHQTGTKMNRSETLDMIKNMMASDKLEILDQRCVYENEEVLVHHSVMTFPDDSREAVMAVYLKKDGQLHSCETGVTKI